MATYTLESRVSVYRYHRNTINTAFYGFADMYPQPYGTKVGANDRSYFCWCGTTTGTGTIDLLEFGTSTVIESVSVGTPASTPTLFTSPDFQYLTTAGAQSQGTLSGSTTALGEYVLVEMDVDEANIISQTTPSYSCHQIESATFHSSTTPVAGDSYYWKYNAADWDGDIEMLVGACFKLETTGMTSVTVYLQEDNGALGGWTDVQTVFTANATIAYAWAIGGTWFTPTDGRSYRLTTAIGSSMYSLEFQSGYFWVRQSKPGGAPTNWRYKWVEEIPFEPTLDYESDKTVSTLHDWNPNNWPPNTQFQIVGCRKGGASQTVGLYDTSDTSSPLVTAAISGDVTYGTKFSKSTLPASATTLSIAQTAENGYDVYNTRLLAYLDFESSGFQSGWALGSNQIIGAGQ